MAPTVVVLLPASFDSTVMVRTVSVVASTVLLYVFVRGQARCMENRRSSSHVEPRKTTTEAPTSGITPLVQL